MHQYTQQELKPGVVTSDATRKQICIGYKISHWLQL